MLAILEAIAEQYNFPVEEIKNVKDYDEIENCVWSTQDENEVL